MYCGDKRCNGPVKPDITFFGEDLDTEFFTIQENVNYMCDLLIVMGTALAVPPFNTTIDNIRKNCPKVLINMTNTDKEGYDFADKHNFPERLFLQGKCDDTVTKIMADCEQAEQFEQFVSEMKGGDPKIIG